MSCAGPRSSASIQAVTAHSAGHALWAGKKQAETFHAALHRDLAELFALLADGTLTAPIDSTYPLADAGSALRRAETGGVAGKIILIPGA